MVGSSPKGALRDAIMISGAQKVEHYEMAAYGTARTYAEVLGRADVARLLDDSLQEEKAADQKLTEIAEQTVNERAAEEFHKQGAGILGQSASGSVRRSERRHARSGAPQARLAFAILTCHVRCATPHPRRPTPSPRRHRPWSSGAAG